MQVLALIIVVATALYYLGSRAVITRWLWSRYPPSLAAFMDCSACSGFWYGFFATIVAGDYRPFPIALPFAAPLTGLVTLVTTPILGGIMQRGFDSLGSITLPDEEA